MTHTGPVREWFGRHPWTAVYTAIIVTVILILHVVELATH